MTATPAMTHPPALAQVLPGMLPAGSYTVEKLQELATVFHQSGLFEDVHDAAQAFVKILKGTELGLPPMAAMEGIDIIRKRLFLKPRVIAALIHACGYGAFQVVEQTPERCTIIFRRKVPGLGWDACPPVSYTLVEARAHGLIERSPHWKTSPAHMLFQRCLGRGGAMYFPELLAGLTPPQDDTPITPEQHAQNLADLYGVETETAAPAPPPADPEIPLDEHVEDLCGPDHGKRGGQMVIEAIESLHRAAGMEEYAIVTWWSRACGKRKVTTPAELPLSALTQLLGDVRRYYGEQEGEEKADAGDQGAQEARYAPE